MLQIETSKGNIYYSSELIKNIVVLSTMECNGVISMTNRNIKKSFNENLKDNMNNGVKVTLVDKKLNVDVFVIVKYGVKVAVIANEIIQKVKNNVESYTGLIVNSITVNVQGVSI